MPNFTPNFNLPYPSASDEPCDFAEQWCDFTAAIDGVFDVFQAGIDRTVPTVPTALMQQTVTRTIENLQPVPFDTVSADTAHMTDIDADPFSITITRFGAYSVSGGIELGSDGGVNSDTAMLIGSSSFTIIGGALDRGVAFLYRMNAYVPSVILSPGEQVRMRFNVGSLLNISVLASWLAVTWHADREVP